MAPTDKPVLVFTDASAKSAAEGILGFYVYDPCDPISGVPRSYVSRLKVPKWLLALFERLKRRKQYINQHELLGMIASYLTLPEVLRGRSVIHYVDNTSALGVALGGYSGALDAARLVNVYHIALMALGCSVWLECVASESNIADWPTREMLQACLQYKDGAQLVTMRIPTLLEMTALWLESYDLMLRR